MLSLVNVQKPDTSYHLLVDQKYSIGRKQGDIMFGDDQSVSRLHAELLVEHPAGNITEPLLTPVLRITDVGSKFGTFATEENILAKNAVNSREPVTISVGDKIRFGLQWNEYRVDYTPFVVSTSSVKATAEFKDRIVKLGGHYTNDWDVKNTHLVMESITLTVKAVCALLAAKPIVTPTYIEKLLSSFQTKTSPPNINSFLPPITEKGINTTKSSFYSNTARTTLFAGKTFMFCTAKHMKKLSAAVEAGGGSAVLISDVSGADVLKSEYIIMGHKHDIEEGERDRRVKAILENYKRGGKRYIIDSEIGLAAVYNSIEKHCNPKYSMSSAVLPNLTTQTQSSSGSSVPTPIVPETQNLETQASSSNGDGSINIVNETVKQEDEPEASNTGHISQSSRGEKRAADNESRSGKKRVADEDLPGTHTKRIKDTSSVKSPSRSLRSSQKSASSRALSSLFNFSSSDDDDDDVSAVPESQPNDTEDNDVEVVPDSQGPEVNVVDVRNLQSVPSTPGSMPLTVGRSEIFRKPTAPATTESSLNTFPNPGTDFIETVSETVMNAKTIPITAKSSSLETTVKETESNSSGRSTRASKIKMNDSITGVESSRKRRREGDDVEAIVENAKKINLEDVKVEDDVPISVARFIKVPLMNKNLSLEISMLGTNESSGNSGIKNYKNFKKVLPKFISDTSLIIGQENRSSSRRNPALSKDTSGINSSINKPQIKMTPIDYTPGGSKRYHRLFSERDIPPPVVPVDKGNDDPDTPPELITWGDGAAHELLSSTIAKERAEREKNIIESKQLKQTSSRGKSASADCEQPSNSGGRRISPRKRGPAHKMGPPAPPLVRQEEEMVVDDDDDDDEDDIWTFKR